MELKSIFYKNVFGHLSGELSFERGENIVVGNNGCGKTTLLNLIRWILEPSLPDLCTLVHDSISIKILHNDITYTIESSIEKKRKLILNVESDNKSRNFKPILVNLRFPPTSIKEKNILLELKENYKHLVPVPHELDTWYFLNYELPKPIYVGLEREVEIGKRSFLQDSNRSFIQEKRSSFRTSTDLMRDSYNKIRRQTIDLNEKLNRKIIELSFSGIIKESDLHKSEIKGKDNLLNKISDFKSNISSKTTSFMALADKSVRSAIIQYLKGLEKLLINNNNNENDLFYVLNKHNFIKAIKIYDIITNHENSINNNEKELILFLEVINGFLSDSNKNIKFDEDTGTPYFKCLKYDERLSLSDLSSGEAQIVILLSYFAFLAKTGIPIIIDEPELSLHVEWQSRFIDAVKKIMPKKCQTIMATHSPEICGAPNVKIIHLSVR